MKFSEAKLEESGCFYYCTLDAFFTLFADYGALWYINTYQVAFVNNDLIYILLMALLVFNFFNFRKKAKCFSGDVGVISIAFVIVFMMGLLILKTKDISYIVLLGLYGVDAI